ncbi:potassium uptake protein KTRB [Mycoplasma suis str. Illinois]|uniref:Potassium uptake protein KTRB n=1 Tax=Mycoplasma suis (strain Illinois) TaxID=768700 RepID=F0QR93_MYCSL|nr:potassium uptake protein KTRB [Mycoplasma suis str. Illinois]
MKPKKANLELFWKTLIGKNIYQRISRVYFLVVLLGFGALNLPFAKGNGGGSNGNWFSNLFIAVSAFTTTGLTTNSLNCSYSWFGQLVVLLLIQVGGLGLVTSWMFIKHCFFKSKKRTIEERLNLHSERGGMSQAHSYDIVMSALKILLSCEVIVAILLTFFFYFVAPSVGCADSFKGDFVKSLWGGIFHSISAINNAGLDIISQNSIMPYSSGWGIILSIIFAISSIIGGIGYPVLYEFKEWCKNKRRRKSSKNIFSLFTKISILMHFLITIIAAGAVILAETTSGNLSCIKSCCLSTSEKVWQLLYLIISARSSGFAGLDITSLHEKTQWILLILMFIGASPASTAGGIRSITLFLIIGKVWVTMRGRKSLSIFSRTVSSQTIDNSFIVFFLSSALVIVASLVIPDKNNGGNGIAQEIGRHAKLFESSSAFGTSGLSIGVTGKTNWVGHIVLMALMYVGQMGVPNVLSYYTKSRPSKQKISYPEEKLRIA